MPVVDMFGRICGRAMLPLSLDAIDSRLASFPMPPDDTEIPDDDEDPDHSEPPEDDGEPPDDDGGDENVGGGGGGGHERTAAIRAIMMLTEQIAARQTRLRGGDWPGWCARLEQTLCCARNDPRIKALRALGLNPISALRHPAFLPEFAEQSEEYRAVLDRVEIAWGLADLPPLLTLETP